MTDSHSDSWWSRLTRNRSSTTPVISSDRGSDPLVALDEFLAAARPIPLTDLVRVDPHMAAPLIDAIRTVGVERGQVDQVEALARVVLDGRPIPFTDQRRVNLRKARKLLRALQKS